MKPIPISETVRKQAVTWLLRGETLSDRERAAFDAWLAEDPRHRLAFEQVSAQWEWLEKFKHTPFPAREAALRYRAPRWQIRQYAAAAVILLAAGLAAISADGWPGLVRTYSTMKGETKTLTLADGSRLELNTDTEVRVHFNHWRRHVALLHGESFFTVRHDPHKPFEVAAGSGAIRDISTAFNVYKRAEQVDVAVQEGRVAVDGAGGTRELAAGQTIAYNRAGRFVAGGKQNIASATLWRQGVLRFQGLRLDAALDEISRYHEIAIRLPDPALAQLRVNGTFRASELNAMLDAVATLLPVRVRRIGEREISLESTR